jgi:hypothetical protein
MTEDNKKAILKTDSSLVNPKELSYFGYLKPFGKVIGNDVFTFHRPNTEELFNTLISFPKPVYWLTSANFLKDLSNREMMHSITVLKLIGGTQKAELGEISIDNLSDFFESIKNQKAMVLISCNEVDGIAFENTIEQVILRLKQQ